MKLDDNRLQKEPTRLHPVVVDEKELDLVNSVKILSITLSSDLKWNVYINETIKEANKRLYFLVLLKRAGVSC